MKHFTLLLGAALTALSVSALPVNDKADLKSVMSERGIDMSHFTTKTQAPSRADAGKYPITYVEGEETNYLVEIDGFLQSWEFGAYLSPYSDMKQVVWDENGDVYIKNLLNIGETYYVKGKLADGKVTIDLPQVAVYMTDGEDELILSLNILKYDPKAKYTYANPEGPQQLVLDVNEDGSLSFDLNPDYDIWGDEATNPEYIVGITGDLTPGVSDWYQYGDYAQTYTEFEVHEVVVPDDAVRESWVLQCTNTDDSEAMEFVKVALSGNDIYLGGLSAEVPAWVKGTITDGKAYFESGQYMGYNELFSSPVYFLSATFEKVHVFDEEWGDDWWDFKVETNDGLTLIYDAEAKTLKTEDPKACFLINGGLDELNYLGIFINPEIKWQDPALCNAAPLTPEFLYYQPWNAEDAMGGIMWSIPYSNVNGALLNTNRMYYHFIVDGEVYGLDPEEYPAVPEYMEDIPYNFSTPDMDIITMGTIHQIYFYFVDADSFGLQSFYVNEQGETFASEIATYVPGQTGINSTPCVEVESTKYFDLTGSEVANPQNGLYIKSMRLADGTTRNVKVIKK